MTATKAWLIAIGWLGAYELYALTHAKQTLSDAIWACEGTNPLVPFGLGLLMGHFVFQTIKNGRPS